MKATGIVRRIDELGRVVIPKEIRRTLRIREGDPLEIFTENDGGIILKKYSPIGELSSYANEFVASLHQTFGFCAAITDSDHIIACAGCKKREYDEKHLTDAMVQAIQQRRSRLFTPISGALPALIDDEEQRNPPVQLLLCPIVALGDAIGAVVLFSRDSEPAIGAAEQKCCEMIAAFLGKQME